MSQSTFLFFLLTTLCSIQTVSATQLPSSTGTGGLADADSSYEGSAREVFSIGGFLGTQAVETDNGKVYSFVGLSFIRNVNAEWSIPVETSFWRMKGHAEEPVVSPNLSVWARYRFFKFQQFGSYAKVGAGVLFYYFQPSMNIGADVEYSFSDNARFFFGVDVFLFYRSSERRSNAASTPLAVAGVRLKIK